MNLTETLQGLRRRRLQGTLLTLAAACACAALGAPRVVEAADGDLGTIDQLVRQGRYQEAADLLAPLQPSGGAEDASYYYLRGRVALGTNRYAEAKELFKRALAADPYLAAAHLGLGRAYYGLGQYAEALIEFQTVLNFPDVAPDLLTQVKTYLQAADQYLEDRRWLFFGYAETGAGWYWTLPTDGSRAVGLDRSEGFFNARVGGGATYLMPNSTAFETTLDYRFRWYDNPDTRNDGDLRWRAAVSRVFDDNNVAIGFRGRNSYRGNGYYRNDYALFTEWRIRVDERNQVVVAGEIRDRVYPSGTLRERSRVVAEGGLGWLRSFADGRGSFQVNAITGVESAVAGRPDGDVVYWGVNGTLNYAFTPKLNGFLYAIYKRDDYNLERARVDPTLGSVGYLKRSDNLLDVGGGLVWEFAPTWTLRPEFLYNNDDSNTALNRWSYIEAWINVRKSF
jgi:tetratricopeptide (TPR) repeat protein